MLNSRASRATWRRSERSALAAPGYWILTATSVPSDHVARCTWPIDAAAAGTSSNVGSCSRQAGPSSASSTRCTTPGGIGGAASWSLVRVSRYGPAISSGRAASKMLIACPNFIAPPLSWPSTLKTWSAVRRCTSSRTASAGAPPSRRPTPSVVRPAKPTGSDASFTPRAKALLGSDWRGRGLSSGTPLRIVADGCSGGRKQSTGAPVVERDRPGDAGVVLRSECEHLTGSSRARSGGDRQHLDRDLGRGSEANRHRQHRPE